MNPIYPPPLANLITYLKKLSGVGTRTAERFAFELLNWPDDQLNGLGSLLAEIHKITPPCPTCSCLMSKGLCPFCSSPIRDLSLLCLISSPKDAYAVEETRLYKGLYHVVEHLLSPLSDRHTHTLRIDRIEERIARHNVKELILAFDSTLEGDTTALYVKKKLEHSPISISRLAFGIPVGSSLEYIDGGTLARALQGRHLV